MTAPLLKLASTTVVDEDKMRRLARFIAMDVYDLGDILKNEGITHEVMAQLVDNPLFRKLIQDAKEAWSSTENTVDRIQLKSKVLVEEFLEEAHARLHDPKESLLHKVALLKEVSRFGGVGQGEAPTNTEKIQVIINLPSSPTPVVVEVASPVPAIAAEYEDITE